MAPASAAPGEGETLCADADRRGLPDGLEVESRAWRTFADTRSDAKRNRKLAEECIARGRRFIADDGTAIAALRPDGEGGTVEADGEEQARKWFAIAAAFNGNVARFVAEQSKVMRFAQESTALRERMAAKERRDRLVARLTSGGKN